MPPPPVVTVGVWIYGLVDPDTGLVCYVGQSVKPCIRFTNHISRFAAPDVVAWVAELAARNAVPTLAILDYTVGDADELELSYIEKFARISPLLNRRKRRKLAPCPVPPYVPATRAAAALSDWFSAGPPGEQRTQCSLAKLVSGVLGRNLHQSTISALRQGAQIPRVDLMLAFQSLLGIQPEWWLTKNGSSAT